MPIAKDVGYNFDLYFYLIILIKNYIKYYIFEWDELKLKVRIINIKIIYVQILVKHIVNLIIFLFKPTNRLYD